MDGQRAVSSPVEIAVSTGYSIGVDVMAVDKTMQGLASSSSSALPAICVFGPRLGQIDVTGRGTSVTHKVASTPPSWYMEPH